MIKFLDLYGQYTKIKSEVDCAVADVIRNASFIGGRNVAEFEHKFALYQGAEHCVGVGNGTDALEIAITALDLPAGSEILVPANSFIATSEAVTRSGHRVVFVDVEESTYTMSVQDAERKINGRTSAMIAVHLYGRPCEMDSLLALSERGHLAFIEDCAQAHGAEYGGRKVGSWGNVGTFSFYPGKNLGAYGDGGAILSNNKALIDKCRMIANHGRMEKYNHVFEGRNSRLDALQAAILSVKLEHLNDWLDIRGKMAAVYVKGLYGVKELVVPDIPVNARHVFHLFVIRCKDRDALAKHLREEGIQTGIHYPVSLPKMRAYDYLGQQDSCPVADRLAGEVLSLPMGDHLDKDDVGVVTRCIRSYYGYE